MTDFSGVQVLEWETFATLEGRLERSFVIQDLIRKKSAYKWSVGVKKIAGDCKCDKLRGFTTHYFKIFFESNKPVEFENRLNMYYQCLHVHEPFFDQIELVEWHANPLAIGEQDERESDIRIRTSVFEPWAMRKKMFQRILQIIPKGTPLLLSIPKLIYMRDFSQVKSLTSFSKHSEKVIPLFSRLQTVAFIPFISVEFASSDLETIINAPQIS